MYKFNRTSEPNDNGRWVYITTITDDEGIHYAGSGDSVSTADHNALYAFANGKSAPAWRKPICLGHILSSKEGNFEVVGINDVSKTFTIRKLEK